MGSVSIKKLLMYTVKYYSQNSPSDCAGGLSVANKKVLMHMVKYYY